MEYSNKGLEELWSSLGCLDKMYCMAGVGYVDCNEHSKGGGGGGFLFVTILDRSHRLVLSHGGSLSWPVMAAGDGHTLGVYPSPGILALSAITAGSNGDQRHKRGTENPASSKHG